jgi:hypothetical protein
VPALIRGDGLARTLRFDKLLRLKVFPLAASLPWGRRTFSAEAGVAIVRLMSVSIMRHRRG